MNKKKDEDQSYIISTTSMMMLIESKSIIGEWSNGERLCVIEMDMLLHVKFSMH